MQASREKVKVMLRIARPGPGSQEWDGEKLGIRMNCRKKDRQGLVVGRLKETRGTKAA